MKHKLLLVTCVFLIFRLSNADAQKTNGIPRFKISFPASVNEKPLTGRMFLIITKTDSIEPRLQVGRYGTQFFGADFENLKPGQEVTISTSTLGYPVNAFNNITPGYYFVQAVLCKYTEFKRSDGHTLWMHKDQWEGQDWRRSPGNDSKWPLLALHSIGQWHRDGRSRPGHRAHYCRRAGTVAERTFDHTIDPLRHLRPRRAAGFFETAR